MFKVKIYEELWRLEMEQFIPCLPSMHCKIESLAAQACGTEEGEG